MVYLFSVTLRPKWNCKSLHTRYSGLAFNSLFLSALSTWDTSKRGSKAVTKRSCRIRRCAKGSALWPARAMSWHGSVVPKREADE